MAIKMSGPGGVEMLRVASRTVSLAGASPDAPRLPAVLMLLPWGNVRSTNGDFLVDGESAAAVLAAFQEHGTDLVIDYEHQSLGGRYASPSGLAPAAGWVTDLEVRGGQGIWGKVRWTLAAARRILRQEYRFLSPVVVVGKEDRKVAWLDSVALTNRPAIAGMQPVVNRRGARARTRGGTGQEQDRRGAARLVGASVEGAEAVTIQTVHAKEAGMQEEWKRLRALLSLGEEMGEQEVARQACERMEEMLAGARQREAEQRVACAMQAGKVSEAQKEWATQFAMRDAANFDEWLKGAPVLVPLRQVVNSVGATADNAASQRRAVIAAARSEYRSNTLLRQLTEEKAYIDEALQQAGIGAPPAEG